MDGLESLRVDELHESWRRMMGVRVQVWEAQWLPEGPPLRFWMVSPQLAAIGVRGCIRKREGSGPQEGNFGCPLPVLSSSFQRLIGFVCFASGLSEDARASPGGGPLVLRWPRKCGTWLSNKYG